MEQEVQRAVIERAVAAAAAGNSVEYFMAIAASHVPDGLIARLRRRWPGMDEDTIYGAVTTAVDSLFAKLSGGGVVSSPLAYLWKAGFNQLNKTRDRREQEVEYDDDNENHVQAEVDASDRRDRLRAEALRFARSLLPRLGEQNLQRVMGFIFECVEQREFHVDNETISKATGLSVPSVRRLKSRGFQRLRREAEREGIELGEQFDADEEELETE
jgi:DNA-directed RNA polymerase specialized sigma24 family protein